MWRRIRRLFEKRGPLAPSVRAMFDNQRATPAVLTFLRDTRVGRIASAAPLRDGWGEKEYSEGEEVGPGPP